MKNLKFGLCRELLVEGHNISLFRKEQIIMQHNLKIKVSKEKSNGGVLACRQVTVREKLLRFILGTPVRLTVLVPGDSVDEVAIKEVPEGGEQREALRN